jgi:hypothetical protein
LQGFPIGGVDHYASPVHHAVPDEASDSRRATIAIPLFMRNPSRRPRRSRLI